MSFDSEKMEPNPLMIITGGLAASKDINKKKETSNQELRIKDLGYVQLKVL